MFRRSDKKRNIQQTPAINKGPDSHKWETKMEIMRLFSGKPDLKLKHIPKPAY